MTRRASSHFHADVIVVAADVTVLLLARFLLPLLRLLSLPVALARLVTLLRLPIVRADVILARRLLYDL